MTAVHVYYLFLLENMVSLSGISCLLEIWLYLTTAYIIIIKVTPSGQVTFNHLCRSIITFWLSYYEFSVSKQKINPLLWQPSLLPPALYLLHLLLGLIGAFMFKPQVFRSHTGVSRMYFCPWLNTLLHSEYKLLSQLSSQADRELMCYHHCRLQVYSMTRELLVFLQ